MNITIFTGNLGRDWELQYGASGNAYARNSLAVRRKFKDKRTGEYETDWVPLTVFGKTAETASRFTGKGSKVGIKGSLQVNQTERDGQKRTYYDVVVDSIEFLDSKGDSQNNQGNYQQRQQPQYQDAADPFAQTNDKVEISDSDLPF